MGEMYSKLDSNAPPTQGVTPASGSQNQRTRETGPNGSHNSGMDHLTADALSRLQNTGSQLPPGSGHSGTRTTTPVDHLFNAPGVVRGVRNQEPSGTSIHTRAPSQEELFAAQLCGQLTPSQLSALAAVYHQQQQQQQHQQQQQQQQQQLQRSGSAPNNPHALNNQFAQALASVAKSSTVSPTFSLGLIGNPPGQGINVSSCGTGSGHTSRTTQLSHPHHPKRPPSRPTQYQSNVGAQTTGGRPSSASQPPVPQHTHQRGTTGVSSSSSYGHAHPAHLGPSLHLPGSALLDPNSAALLSGHSPITVCRSPSAHHTTSVPVASPSQSPGPGRRSQLAPPSVHPNKRPRLTSAIQHQSPQHMLSTGPTVCHAVATSLAAGMEALMSSAAASKAIVNLASNPNFLNPNAYSSVTEAAAAAAAAAAFSPLFSAAINQANLSNLSGAIASSPSVTNQPNAFQSHLSLHHSRPTSATGGSAGAPVTHNLHQQQGLQQPQTTAPPAQPQSQAQQQHVLSSGGSYANPLGTTSRTNYAHVPTAAPSASTNTNFGAQPTASPHPGPAHLTGKSTHVVSATTNLPPVASRLPSGHLHHPAHHMGTTHPTAHSFHGAAHAVSQSNSSHNVLGHANLPQGSGVLRQQTKEPAYHPQVEAISPAPEESRLADAQDAKLHREREEISRQLAVVDADINKQEAHLRHLCERENRLATRLAAVPASSTTVSGSTAGSQTADWKGEALTVDGKSAIVEGSQVSDMERTYENPIQSLISENRQRARQHHLIFQPLCGPHVKASPYALPLYRQPSDLASLRAVRCHFRQRFRSQLLHYLRRRRRAEQCRIRFLAQQYAHHSAIFAKKMEKLLNNSKRRQRDLRHRDIFEKALPEVKRNREDREMSAAEATRPTSTDGADPACQTANGMVDGNQAAVYDPVEEMNKMEEYAIDPPLLLAPWQRRYRFVCQAGLVTECRAQLQEAHDISRWTDEEKQIFRERFLATPKNFLSIASFLEGKSVAECIRYYYLSKKTEGYKQLLKKHTARRRRAAQSDRTGGGGGGGATGSGNAGTGGGGAASSNSHPPSSSYGNGPSGDGNNTHDSPGTGGGTSLLPDSTSVKDSEHKSSGRKEHTTSHSGGGRTRPSRVRPTGSSANGSLGSNTSTTQSNPTADADEHSMQSKSRSRINDNKAELDKNTKADGKSSSKSASSSLLSQEGHTSSQVNPGTKKDCVTVSTTENKAVLSCSTVTSFSTPSSTPSVTVSLSNPLHTALRTDGSSPDQVDGAPTKAALSDSTPPTTGSSITSGSTCIKDLIHIAIEKNLTQPFNHEIQSTTDAGDSSPSAGKATARPYKTSTNPQSTGLGPGSKLPGARHMTESLSRQVMDASRGPAPSDPLALSCPPLNKQHTFRSEELSSKCLFPSIPSAGFYAAAARIAAESVNSSGLSNDMTAMCVAAAAAAAATAAVTARGDRDALIHSNTRILPSATQFNSGLCDTSTPSTPTRKSIVPAVTAADKPATNLLLSSFGINPVNSQLAISHPTPQQQQQQPNVSTPSKAILLGDFLTAQQLERSESANQTTSNSARSDRTTSAVNYSRSINPATLPVPIGPKTHRPSGPRWVSALSDAVPNNDFSGLSLSAEHAAWLAIHAEAAAAAAAAAVSTASRSSSPSVEQSNPNTDNERCTYSPLSPNPLKNDHSLSDRMSPGHNSLNKIGPRRSPASSVSTHSMETTDVSRLAIFMSNAQKRYSDEIECYRIRDRSDSMRTLTSSEASQFVGAIQTARKHYQEQQLEQQLQQTKDSAHSRVTTTTAEVERFELAKTQRSTGPAVAHPPPRPRSSGPREEIRVINRHLSPSKLGCVSPIPLHNKHNDLEVRYLDQESDELTGSISMDTAFRRRGYTESQINRRFSGPIPMSSASITSSDAPMTGSSLTSSVSKDKSSMSSGLASLNPATYIDALIHSHLNRNSHNTDESDSVPPVAKTGVTDIHAAGTKDSSISDRNNSSGQKNADGNTRRTQSEDSLAHGSSELPPKTASELETAKRNHLVLPSKNTLEEQINKAIAEEIRAQIRSKSVEAVSAVDVAGTVATSASSNPPTIDAPVSSAGVPLKKRDRSASFLLHQTNSNLAPLSPLDNSTASGPVDSVSSSLNNSELLDKKGFSVTCSNGMPLSHETGSRFQLDSRVWQLNSASSANENAKFTLSAAKRSQPDDDQPDDGRRSCNVPDIICTSGSVKPPGMNSSNDPHSPLLGEADSPGNLQIDLAAADGSPSFSLTESSLPSASPKAFVPSEDTLTSGGDSGPRMRILPAPIIQSTCRNESGSVPYGSVDCPSARLGSLAAHTKSLAPLLNLSGPDLVQLAQSQAVNPKSSPHAVVHQPT